MRQEENAKRHFEAQRNRVEHELKLKEAHERKRSERESRSQGSLEFTRMEKERMINETAAQHQQRIEGHHYHHQHIHIIHSIHPIPFQS